MKTLRQVGLIVEGNSTRSVILRLPGIAEEIGPIKAVTTRVARRVSNFFRAGNVVENYEDLKNCDLVLMRVPDESIPRIVHEIAASQLETSRISFVLCESWLSSDVLKPLSDRGAAVATVVSVPASARNWFAIDPDCRPGHRRNSSSDCSSKRAPAQSSCVPVRNICTSLQLPLLKHCLGLSSSRRSAP